jgi:hypothetical protein
MADLAGTIRDAVAEADIEQLRAVVLAVLNKLHAEHEVRDHAGNYRYSICGDCCMDNDDNQSPTCRLHHEHSGPLSGRCWPCTTWHVAARGLRVRAPEFGLS